MEELNRLVSTIYVANKNAQTRHHFVIGDNFWQLHKLFDKIYKGLFDHYDTLMESFRTIEGSRGWLVHTLHDIILNSVIQEMDDITPNDNFNEYATQMATELNVIIGMINKIIADNELDGITIDVITGVGDEIKEFYYFIGSYSGRF